MALALTDLDQHPEHVEEVLRFFRACPPGRDHAVIGIPWRMAMEPTRNDLDHCLGVLIAIDGQRVRGALAICPYSDQQVTLWGPVIHRGHLHEGIGSLVLEEARRALREGGFESLRMLVDLRNRTARAFCLAKGLAPWKDDVICECRLDADLPPVREVTLARPGDHREIFHLLSATFPESGHLERSIGEREREGYRHHILQDSGHIVAVAAVRSAPGRSWLSLLAVHPEHRRRGHGRTLIRGVLANERSLGVPRVGLEVLADNTAALELYRQCGFERSWTATIMTGPV